MAFQDSFARPLAKTLVNKFRVSSLDYVRVDTPVYDVQTGAVTPSETTFNKAGAVLPAITDQANGVAGNEIEIQAVICLADVGDVIPTTRDRLSYQGKSWQIVKVETITGDQLYSSTVTARAN